MKGKKSKDRVRTLKLAEEFADWYEGLAHLDKINFDALLKLPNALDLLAKCSDKRYTQMGAFALGIRGLLKEDGK